MFFLHFTLCVLTHESFLKIVKQYKGTCVVFPGGQKKKSLNRILMKICHLCIEWPAAHVARIAG